MKVIGTICMFISPKGKVVGTGQSFEQSSPGGFTVDEFQEVLAERFASSNTIKNMIWNEDLHSLSEFAIQQVIDHLKGKGYLNGVE